MGGTLTAECTSLANGLCPEIIFFFFFLSSPRSILQGTSNYFRQVTEQDG